MFAIAPLHPLQNAMIEIIAANPDMTIADLRKELAVKRKMAVSLQHVYRVVNEMIEEQILLKVGGAVSLNLMWLSYIGFFCDRARSIKIEHSGPGTIFSLKDGEKAHFPASTMLELETIWNHLLVQLRRARPEETRLYKFYSHAWWQLGKNAGRETAFYQKIAESGVTCYWLFGSRTPLDERATEWIKEIFPCHVAAQSPFPHEGYNLNVYGEYVVEAILPSAIAKHFSAFFKRTASMDDFDAELFLDLFTQRAKFDVTVWKNPKQADLLRKKLSAFF